MTTSKTSRTVLLTGANRGIGLALTLELLGRGDQVIAACRNPDQATALAALAGRGLRRVTLDVSSVESVARLADQLGGEALDVVISNAGIAEDLGGLRAFDAAVWRRTYEVNVFGAVAVASAFLPNLLSGREKKLINISSAAGSLTNAREDNPAYRSSKAALNMAMRCAAIELKAEGIAVAILSPGIVATDMTSQRHDAKMITPEESARGLADRIEETTLENSGSFRRYNGDQIPW